VEEQVNLFDPIPTDRLEAAPRELLVNYIRLMEPFILDLQKQLKAAKEKEFWVQDQLLRTKDELYGQSSEKLAAPETTTGEDLESPRATSPIEGSSSSSKKRRVLLPSERYPNAPLVVRQVELAEIPNCSCCGKKLVDSGMTEDLEYIEKIPASYQVIREKKHKYNCSSCHGDMKTTPATPKIKPGSAYGDGTIIDVGVSKFCDLIPIDRQVKMAGRLGFEGLPPQSLIETTHYLANFLRVIYEKIKLETLSDRVLYADETPHRMLEGSDKNNWYFWGFSGEKSAYFEAHDTRSGDVAIEFLKDSSCEYLMSDVYSGYVKTATSVNEYRKGLGKQALKKIYCNAHARRKFKEAKVFNEHRYFLEQYQKIYHLNDTCREKRGEEILEIRSKMMPIFAEMKSEAIRLMCSFSNKSSIVRAFQYFLKNYDELTSFVSSEIAPIDNNHQERLLRNPVVGRKTWYGTHSVRGAETTAILFSLMESCKMNKVNPRVYLTEVTKMIHVGKDPITPAQFSLN